LTYGQGKKAVPADLEEQLEAMTEKLKEQKDNTEALQRELRLVTPISRAPRFKQDVPSDLHETVSQQGKKLDQLEDMVRVRTSKVPEGGRILLWTISNSNQALQT